MISDTTSLALPSNVDTIATNSSFQITIHKLNGKNLEWVQSVKLAIDGCGKLGYLTGEAKKLDVKDPTFQAWRSENSLVIAWLLNSMEISVAKPHVLAYGKRGVGFHL